MRPSPRMIDASTLKESACIFFFFFFSFRGPPTCPRGSAGVPHLHFSFRDTQGDSWALCPTVSAVSLASETPCTNIEDLKTLITVYSKCCCECLISEVSKILPLFCLLS